MKKRVPRFIPKRAFQAIALVLLAVCLALTVAWIAGDAGLYRVLLSALGRRHRAWAMLLTFAALFAGWLLLVAPLRLLSRMPTTREELGADLRDGLPAFVAAVKKRFAVEMARNEAMARAARPTPAMRRRAREVGAGLLLAGVLLGLAAAWAWIAALEESYLLRLAIVLAIASPAFVVAGLVQVVTGRPVVRGRSPSPPEPPSGPPEP